MSIFLSLGSNLGDKSENLSKARSLLEKNGVKILAESSIIETAAWGIDNQPDFLNQVLKVDFYNDFEMMPCVGEKDPYTLLCICQRIEREMGKIMVGEDGYVKWGPRIIDIDILQYDNIVSSDSELTLPHHTMEKDYIKKLLKEF